MASSHFNAMLGCEKRNRVYENKWEIIWKRINRVKIKLNDGSAGTWFTFSLGKTIGANNW